MPGMTIVGYNCSLKWNCGRLASHLFSHHVGCNLFLRGRKHSRFSNLSTPSTQTNGKVNRTVASLLNLSSSFCSPKK